MDAGEGLAWSRVVEKEPSKGRKKCGKEKSVTGGN